MTLTTHGVTGALIVASMPVYPVVGLILAFGSHFLLDALPHWDYKILSLDKIEAKKGVVVMTGGRNFFLDLFRIGTDGFLGLMLTAGISLFFFDSVLWLLIAGALAAMFPDFLQFVFGRFKFEFLRPLQNFHSDIHTKIKIENNLLYGVGSQAGLICLCLILFYYLRLI